MRELLLAINDHCVELAYDVTETEQQTLFNTIKNHKYSFSVWLSNSLNNLVLLKREDSKISCYFLKINSAVSLTKFQKTYNQNPKKMMQFVKKRGFELF